MSTLKGDRLNDRANLFSPASGLLNAAFNRSSVQVPMPFSFDGPVLEAWISVARFCPCIGGRIAEETRPRDLLLKPQARLGSRPNPIEPKRRSIGNVGCHSVFGKAVPFFALPFYRSVRADAAGRVRSPPVGKNSKCREPPFFLA